MVLLHCAPYSRIPWALHKTNASIVPATGEWNTNIYQYSYKYSPNVYFHFYSSCTLYCRTFVHSAMVSKYRCFCFSILTFHILHKYFNCSLTVYLRIKRFEKKILLFLYCIVVFFYCIYHCYMGVWNLWRSIKFHSPSDKLFVKCFERRSFPEGLYFNGYTCVCVRSCLGQ